MKIDIERLRALAEADGENGRPYFGGVVIEIHELKELLRRLDVATETLRWYVENPIWKNSNGTSSGDRARTALREMEGEG